MDKRTPNRTGEGLFKLRARHQSRTIKGGAEMGLLELASVIFTRFSLS